MLIRKEEQNDYEEVYNLIKKAFETAEHSDGNEHELAVKLRKSEKFVPELSLVALKDDNIVGHIMFTEILVGNQKGLALAPLSVSPECQKQGIGQALMQEAHKIAADMGYEFSVVLGSEKYYPKAGYVPAEKYGIKAPFEVPSEKFMVLDLFGQLGVLNGTVEYAKEFFD